MPCASPAYLALGDEARKHGCILGLSIRKPSPAQGHELGELIVRSRTGGLPGLLATEPIVAGDHNSAATRLLSRLKRKERWA